MTVQAHKRDKWIPWYFVAFFVGLAMVDGLFVFLATSTHTGLVTQNAYQKGLNYNTTITAAEQQEHMGWIGKIGYQGGNLVFVLIDKQQKPIEGAQAMAYFSRPTQAGSDFSVPLAESGDGIYSKYINFPLKGQWEVKVMAEWKQQSYQTQQRIMAE